MNKKKIQKNWNNIFKKKKWGEYPAEDLVRFIKKLKEKQINKNLKILELGCGTGGNLWFFGKEKIFFDAIDISDIAIKRINNIFQNKYRNYKNFKKKILSCDVLDMPEIFKNYDAIIDSETLCYSSLQEFRLIENMVHKKLKRGGIFWSRIFSYKTSGCNSGKKISKDFRIPSYGPLKGYGPTRILKFKDVKKIYSKFWKSIEISELTRRSRKHIIHELIIEARK